MGDYRPYGDEHGRGEYSLKGFYNYWPDYDKHLTDDLRNPESSKWNYPFVSHKCGGIPQAGQDPPGGKTGKYSFDLPPARNEWNSELHRDWMYDTWEKQ